jgi:hypothetical protein
VTYSLPGLGISNIHYSTSDILNVTALLANPKANQALFRVTQESGSPILSLTPQNFNFYNYSYTNSTWVTSVHPPSASFYAFGNGTYLMSTPNGVSSNAYTVQVTDSRGIMVTLSRTPCYNYSFSWNPAYYNSSLKNGVIVVEALQNGSLRWLGQNLQLTGQGRPIPSIPIKDFRVNETINGINQQVPFQIEDWASKCTVPLGISSNESIFGGNSGIQNMLVFLINDSVSSARIWWDGRDSANQTSYATTDKYFKGDNPSGGVLTNGILTLQIASTSNFTIISTIGTSQVSARFMRVDHYMPVYGSSQAYVITNGIVRDIVQQEAEWSGGISTSSGATANCPNVYSQIVITLPATATYYTYALRTIFVNSSQSRKISDMSPIQLSISYNSQGGILTENGTNSNGYPNTSNKTTPFYNFTSTSFNTGWAHHWSEFVQKNQTNSHYYGGGLMFNNASNFKLYAFDKIANAKTGSLNVTKTSQNVVIEIDPVTSGRGNASFQYPLDLTWYGAVVNFNGTEPIYPGSGSSNELGLWVLVEEPPTVRNVPTVTISPASIVMTVGQSQTFTSTVSGGTTPYSFQWYLDGNTVSGATSSSWTYTPAASANGTHTVCVKLTDYAGLQATSNNATVIVNPFQLSITPSSVTMDYGQSQIFSSSVSGGTGPYSYQWYLNGAKVSGATGPTWTFTPSSTGTFAIYVKATNNTGAQSTSNTATATVNAALSVTISPIPVTMDYGQSQIFSSSVSGGTGPYSYQWYLNGAKVSGATGPTWTFTPSAGGSTTIYVKITDSASTQVTTQSNIASVTVNAALSVAVSPNSVIMDVGRSREFTATVTGGTSPYTYQWYLNGTTISGATGTTYTFTPSSTAHYNIYVNVTDSSTTPNTSRSNIAIVTVVPFGLDGSAQSSTTGNSIALSLTTTYPNDLIYLSVTEGTSARVSSVTSTGLTWNRRANATYTGTGGVRVETWWAVSSSSGSISITITLNASSSAAAVAFGISGANTTSPFDGTYATNTGSGSPAKASKTTTNADDFIIGAIGVNSNPSITVTRGSGFTLILTQASDNTRETSDQYCTASATGTYTPSYSYLSGNNWAMIVDAIKQAS